MLNGHMWSLATLLRGEILDNLFLNLGSADTEMFQISYFACNSESPLISKHSSYKLLALQIFKISILLRSSPSASILVQASLSSGIEKLLPTSTLSSFQVNLPYKCSLFIQHNSHHDTFLDPNTTNI